MFGGVAFRSRSPRRQPPDAYRSADPACGSSGCDTDGFWLGGGWSAKVEGLYVFGKSQSVTHYYENDPTDYGKRFSTKASSAVVRFGVNYRFGGASPVVARY